MCALVAELVAQCHGALVHHGLVPRGGDGHSSAEDAGVVGDSDGKGTVVEAEAFEVGNPVDLGRGPDAWTCGGSAFGLSAHDVTRYEPPMSPRPINAR